MDVPLSRYHGSGNTAGIAPIDCLTARLRLSNNSQRFMAYVLSLRIEPDGVSPLYRIWGGDTFSPRKTLEVFRSRSRAVTANATAKNGHF